MTSDELRAKFESVFSTGHKVTDRFNFIYHTNGRYAADRIQAIWQGWQACYAAMQGEDVVRDAERYRLLRDSNDEGVWLGVGKVVSCCDEYPQYENVCWLSGGEIDSAIDAAMGERHG